MIPNCYKVKYLQVISLFNIFSVEQWTIDIIWLVSTGRIVMCTRGWHGFDI